jgi:hypothetical protein
VRQAAWRRRGGGGELLRRLARARKTHRMGPRWPMVRLWLLLEMGAPLLVVQ